MADEILLIDEWNTEVLFIEVISNYLDFKGAIEYKGVDLRSAISRHLYYLMCNDVSFRKYLADINKRVISTSYVFSKRELAEVADFIQKKNNLKCKIIYDVKQHLYSNLKNLLKRSFLSKAFSVFKELLGRKKNYHNLDILIYSSNAKFTRQFNQLNFREYSTAFIVSSKKDAIKVGIDLSRSVFILSLYSEKIDPALQVWASIIHYFDKLETTILTYSPRMILYYEGDSAHHELLALIGRKYSIESVCLQWGAYPFPGLLNGFRGLSCHYFFSWGKLFINQLQDFNPIPKFIATGHPGLVSRTETSCQDSIAFLLNTGSSIPTMGFNSQHKLFFDLIIWVAETYHLKKILVRPHPSIPLTREELKSLNRYKNIVIDNPHDVILQSTLDKSIIAIGFTSSSLIEAVGCGVVPVVLNPYPWSYQPNLQNLGVGAECKTSEAVKDYLMELLDNNDMLLRSTRAKLLEKRSEIFECIGNDAANLIANEIHWLLINK